MATHEETVVLSVEDKLSSGAASAQGALSRLENQIAREQGALSRLEASLVKAKAAMQGIAAGDAKGTVNVGAYRKAQDAVTALQDKIGTSKDKVGALTDKLKLLGSGAEKGAPPFRAMAKYAKEFSGEAGAATSHTLKLVQTLIKIGPTLAAALTAFILATSVITGFIGVVAKGISVVNESRDKTLELAAAGVTLYNANRSSIASGQQLSDTISRVSQTTALAKDEVFKYGAALKNSLGFYGQQIFTAKQLESTLKTATLVATGGNDRLAKSYIETAKWVRSMGGDLEKLDERMRKKFGAVAEAKMLSLGVQMQKLKEKITYLFNGADIEPFLKGLQSVLSIFDQQGAAAQSLRSIITKTVETAIGWMLRFAIALVRTYIYLKTHETAWKTLGFVVKGIGIVVVASLAAMGIAFGLVGVAIAAVGAVVAAFAAYAGLVTEQLSRLFSGLSWEGVKKIFNNAIAWLKSIDFIEIGKSMILGIGKGIIAAAPAFYDALKSVVTGGINKVKNFLEVGSPSELMRREVGYPMGTGIAAGNEDAAPAIAASSKAMVQTGVESAKAAPAGGTSPAGLPPISFVNCTFGSNFEDDVRKAFTHILQGEILATPEPS